MTSQINNQPCTVNILVLPDCIGAHNNVSPSLPPTQGTLVQDTTGPAGAIYSGTGLQYNLVGGGGSTIIGPAVSTINDIATWGNISGSQLLDSAVSINNVVTNTGGSVTSTDLVAFNGTGGRAVQDSGILTANVVQNTGGVVVSGDLASFSGTGGRLITDSGVVAANIVTGPASSTSTDLASFNGTTGKIVQDSGILTANVAWTSGAVTSGDLVSYSGTGKQIQDTSIAAANVAWTSGAVTSGDLVSYSGINKEIQDSGITASSVTTSSGAVTSGDLVSYSGTGNQIQDSGIASANVATTSGAVTSGHIVTYTGTGKAIQDGGTLASNLVTGPASTISGNLCSFNGTTGKIIQNSGIPGTIFVQPTSGNFSTNRLASFGIGGTFPTLNVTLQDSGVIFLNSRSTTTTLTSTSGLNPNFTNVTLSVQKMTISSPSGSATTINYMFQINAAASITTTSMPDSWFFNSLTLGSTVNTLLPAIFTVAGSPVVGYVQINGTILTLFPLSSTTGTLVFNNISGVYS